MSGVVKAHAGVHSGRHNASLHSRARAKRGPKRRSCPPVEMSFYQRLSGLSPRTLERKILLHLRCQLWREECKDGIYTVYGIYKVYIHIYDSPVDIKKTAE